MFRKRLLIGGEVADPGTRISTPSPIKIPVLFFILQHGLAFQATNLDANSCGQINSFPQQKRTGNDPKSNFPEQISGSMYTMQFQFAQAAEFTIFAHVMETLRVLLKQSEQTV